MTWVTAQVVGDWRGWKQFIVFGSFLYSFSYTVGWEIFAVNKFSWSINFRGFHGCGRTAKFNLHVKVLARDSSEIFAVITSNHENKNREIFE